MRESILRDRSFVFAVRVTKFCQNMINEKEFILSRQLLKSGTAIGALVREAQYAESTADFRHKLTIALKEANESDYWIDLINETYPGFESKVPSLKMECKELVSMLVASTKTLKGRVN